MLQSITMPQDLDYNKYEDKIKEAELWANYQQILLKIMSQIADLTYAMNLGAISRENSNYLIQPYAKQSCDILEDLNKWHNIQCEKLEIDKEKQRRKRQGIEGALFNVLGIFNDDLRYKEVSEETILKIEHQSVFEEIIKAEHDDLFKEDVELVMKNEKMYYLPKC